MALPPPKPVRRLRPAEAAGVVATAFLKANCAIRIFAIFTQPSLGRCARIAKRRSDSLPFACGVHVQGRSIDVIAEDEHVFRAFTTREP